MFIGDKGMLLGNGKLLPATEANHLGDVAYQTRKKIETVSRRGGQHGRPLGVGPVH